eukprot:5547361-Pyramimonas_sp.AAC.1
MPRSCARGQKRLERQTSVSLHRCPPITFHERATSAHHWSACERASTRRLTFRLTLNPLSSARPRNPSA